MFLKLVDPEGESYALEVSPKAFVLSRTPVFVIVPFTALFYLNCLLSCLMYGACRRLATNTSVVV